MLFTISSFFEELLRYFLIFEKLNDSFSILKLSKESDGEVYFHVLYCLTIKQYFS